MESDGEIEYLDEDADIVQQYVQPPVDLPASSSVLKRPVLVERKFKTVRAPKASRKRKRLKTEESDSDYNPNDDVYAPIPAGSSKKKKSVRKSDRKRNDTPVKTVSSAQVQSTLPRTVMNRKKMDIRIPDYEDPLCLPVRVLKTADIDGHRLKHWNNACLEHFKQSDSMFRPEKGSTKGSSRTVVLRNVVHKETKNIETAVWMKTCVENQEGVKKSEIFQCILPKYREKKMLSTFNVYSSRKKNIHHVNEVLLTKEVHKDGEVLVAYKPKENSTAVYKYAKNYESGEDEEKKVSLKEVVYCKICAPCYQTSWRGADKIKEKKTLQCPICGRKALSTYNMLTHLKAHSNIEVRQHKRVLSKALAEVLDYHYKCRVCQLKLNNIKSLRQHVVTHRGVAPFKCEIGSHMTT